MVKEKIKSIAEIELISKEIKRKGERIVSTNGVFDIIHLGHIRYLEDAKKEGDKLIVAINSDSSVRKNKGPKRPLNDENSRAEVLSGLSCVDYVVIFEETEPSKILSVIKPDVHVKGGDYDISQIIEKKAVEENGGKVVLIGVIDGFSTTGLIERIIKRYCESKE